ncbi:hypothetical protein [Salinimicrobium sediminilitoris]|uniref:hypothetical protein n=1 Tax=Salinimicrobium sediminilitoris TaxID=2876715 RepID=UPI001E5B5CF3|nr:hypothetical protein [Salinimicrobium sediminilitoris]MCC8361005.1 hypothetical protein [Salinimicrobium sediminilitoris]
MRFLLKMLLLFWMGPLYSQAVYSSYYTESFPTIFRSQINKVNRQITFDPNAVTIATEVKGGKEIQVLTVQEVNYNEGVVQIFCTNRNDQKVTIVLPEQEKVEIIDYYALHPKTGEEYQLRFHVERIP